MQKLFQNDIPPPHPTSLHRGAGCLAHLSSCRSNCAVCWTVKGEDRKTETSLTCATWDDLEFYSLRSRAPQPAPDPTSLHFPPFNSVLTALLLCCPQISALQNHSSRNQTSTSWLRRKPERQRWWQNINQRWFLTAAEWVFHSCKTKSCVGHIPIPKTELSSRHDFLLSTTKCALLLRMDLCLLPCVHENAAL